MSAFNSTDHPGDRNVRLETARNVVWTDPSQPGAGDVENNSSRTPSGAWIVQAMQGP